MLCQAILANVHWLWIHCLSTLAKNSSTSSHIYSDDGNWRLMKYHPSQGLLLASPRIIKKYWSFVNIFHKGQLLYPLPSIDPGLRAERVFCDPAFWLFQHIHETVDLLFEEAFKDQFWPWPHYPLNLWLLFELFNQQWLAFVCFTFEIFNSLQTDITISFLFWFKLEFNWG